jgi:protein-tyrosine phosphatase
MTPTIPGWSGAPRSGEPGAYAICFVCTGNICRSPMAEVVLGALAAPLTHDGTLGARLIVSSAGTGNWHEGEPMDPRARQALEDAGYTDHGHVAHAITRRDVAALDLLIGLDRRHLETVRGRATRQGVETAMALLRSFDPSAGGHMDVPDPYYGDDAEFAACLAMIESGCRGLLDALVQAIGPATVGSAAPEGAGEGR